MAFEMLLSSKKIGNVEIPNRIVMPPMGVNMGDGSGQINEQYIAYFEERAKGGVGLITSSACAVDTDYCGIAEPGQICLNKDGAVEGVRDIMERVHKHGGKMIFQLLHPGRQGSSYINRGQQPVGPSAIKEAEYLEMPRVLSAEEIKFLVQKYVLAAKNAFEGGADGVEVHGAHGYLLHQFMSPRANKRTDLYGGSFENRMRFITEIISGIQAIKPENTFISVRINGMDGLEDGFQVEDCIKIAKYLENIGIDVLSVSSGTYSRIDLVIEPAIIEEGWRTDAYVTPIRNAISIPLISANNIKRPVTAERILQSGACDFVCLGRGSLADPEFGKKVKEGNADKIHICISCNNCGDQVQAGKTISCSVNPRLGHEAEYAEEKLVRNGNGRSVVVIGGGPGGMEAAILSAKRGFKVTIFDKEESLGGALLLATKAPGKDKVGWTLDSYRSRIRDLDIDVKLNHSATSLEEINKLSPYAIVVATGAVPFKPPISGLDMEHVVLAHDVLKNPGQYKDKKVVLVGSGMTGLETAEVLVENGNSVDIYEMLDEIGKGSNLANKYASMGFLGGKGTSFFTRHQLLEVTESEVRFNNLETQGIVSVKADLVVLSLGIKADSTVTEMLQDTEAKLCVLGDCAGGRKIADATTGAYEAVWAI